MRFAGFWRRWVAFVVDWIVIQITSGVVVRLALLINGSVASEVSGRSLQWLGGIAAALCALIYFSMCHLRWGMTPGKRLMGVRVVDARSGGGLGLGQAFVRTLAMVPSYALLMIGFVMAAFDPKKRALHDRLAGTLCLRAGPPQGESDLEVGQVDVPELP